MKATSLIASWFAIGTCVLSACGGASTSDVFGAPSSEVAGPGTAGGPGAAGGGTGANGGPGATGAPGDAGAVTVLVPCAPLAPNACKADEYCKVATCGAPLGSCAPKPANSNAVSPVCGCDNVTYWNESVAVREFGVSTKSAGECAPTEVSRCSTNGIKCPANRVCNLAVANKAACVLPAAVLGTCWGLPRTCPVGDSKYADCRNENCKSQCEAIKAEKSSFMDNGC
jgi:hypothetical protein